MSADIPNVPRRAAEGRDLNAGGAERAAGVAAVYSVENESKWAARLVCAGSLLTLVFQIAYFAGALIVEPWFTPDQWNPGRLFVHVGEIGVAKVCRMSLSGRDGDVSILLYHYLRGTPDGIEHYTERLELGLFTRDEMTWAFESVQMAVRYDSDGLMGRGLYLAIQRI